MLTMIDIFHDLAKGYGQTNCNIFIYLIHIVIEFQKWSH